MSVNEKLAALMAKYNVEDADITGENDDSPERVSFRGEALLYAIEYPLQPRVTKSCKSCGDTFLSYYKSVAHCSQRCLRAELKKMGLDWHPNGDLRRERWDRHAEPRMIPLKALQAMKAIVAQAEADLGHSIALPPIAAYAPPASYFPQHETPKYPEAYQISVSPLPQESQSECTPASASSPLPDPTSADNTGKSEAPFPEPVQPSTEPDPLEWLFAD